MRRAFSLFLIPLLFSSFSYAQETAPDIQALLNKAAHWDSDAQYELGELYTEGKGVKQNFEEALFWAMLSDETGNNLNKNGPRKSEVAARMAMGKIFDTMKRIKEWKQAHISELKIALNEKYQGKPKQVLLADYGAQGKRWGISEQPVIIDNSPCKENTNIIGSRGGNQEIVILWCPDNHGNVTWIDAGLNLPPAVRRALEWRALAEKGNAGAQASLGGIYDRGEGVSKNPEEAMKWYRKAANSGNAEMKRLLAIPPADIVKKAADKGDAEAQYNLGTLYFAGRGVSRDIAEGAKWFRKSAEQGHASAEWVLGALLMSGMGMTKNEAESAVWIRKAADSGIADAQWHIAGMYAHGRQGVAQDWSEAYYWASLGKAAQPSGILQNEAAKHLSPEQKSAVDKRVEEWLKAHPAPTTTSVP